MKMNLNLCSVPYKLVYQRSTERQAAQSILYFALLYTRGDISI